VETFFLFLVFLVDVWLLSYIGSSFVVKGQRFTTKNLPKRHEIRLKERQHVLADERKWFK